MKPARIIGWYVKLGPLYANGAGGFVRERHRGFLFLLETNPRELLHGIRWARAHMRALRAQADGGETMRLVRVVKRGAS